MEWLLTHIANNFNEYLIVSLLVVLFFKESLMAFINSKLGRENDTPAWGKKATADINRLAQYANHDTTERLERIIDLNNEHQRYTLETRDSLKDISRTLAEIKTYGIPCRDK